jgi:hypothetical protein
MTDAPVQTSAPARSRVASLVASAWFHDAWAIEAAQPELDALGQFLRVARQTPAWIEGLMALRNRVVSLVGLKDLGALSRLDPGKHADDYRPGERVGIFTLISRSADEVLLGDSDRHLDVVVSVHRQRLDGVGPVVVTVTTVVHVHNRLGRLYMLPVRPLHRLIVRAMTRAVGRHGSSTPSVP